MSDLERIKVYIQWLISNRIAKNQEEIGFLMGYKSKSAFSQVINGHVPLPYDFIQRLSELSDKGNIKWLLTGEGDMLKTENMVMESRAQYGNARQVDIDRDHLKTAPLISQYAYGGYLRGFADQEYLQEQPVYYIKIKHNHGNYVAFEVRGDSMDDSSKRSICEGDLVLGCELMKEYWKSRLHVPKVFIIVHKDEGIIIKEVIKHDVEKGIILCHSWNPMPEYEDFELNLEDVMQLFYIKEITRNNKL